MMDCFRVSIVNFEFFTIISFNPVQFLKANKPIFSIESSIINFVNPVHPSNALAPISVTALGICISVNFVYPLNADAFIFTAVLGNSIIVADLHPTPTIFVIPSSYITFSIPVHPVNDGLFPNIYCKIRTFYHYLFYTCTIFEC